MGMEAIYRFQALLGASSRSRTGDTWPIHYSSPSLCLWSLGPAHRPFLKHCFPYVAPVPAPKSALVSPDPRPGLESPLRASVGLGQKGAQGEESCSEV